MSATPANRGPARPAEAEAGQEPRQAGGVPAIVLARHGRPALDRRLTLGWRGYAAWWQAYDESGLAPGERPPQALLAVARDAHAVLASPLKRSLETAHAVAEGREVVADPVFVEAALPPPPIPGLRLKPTHWGVVARVAWYYGYSGGQESRVEAEARAERAVDRILEDLAGEPENERVVLVCAHGWFNRMMRPVLQARGWRCVRDGRDGYWSFRRYELTPDADPAAALTPRRPS
jgi:broad specificity phosphatase PhoE